MEIGIQINNLKSMNNIKKFLELNKLSNYNLIN